jgi:hypothetical protein
MMKHVQQQHSNHQRRQHLTYKIDSPKETSQIRKQYKSVVVAQSMILDFHPGESSILENNRFGKAIFRYNQ